MKINKPENPNYAAVVVKIKTLVPLDGCDNVVGTPLLGFQAIVSKNTQIGDIGIVFPAETELSEEFCYENNLYRHDDKNKNLGVKGYLEDNRRIKAIKFRGHTSNSLFMPLESFSYTGTKPSDFNEGDEFDTLNDHKICQKYVVKRKEPRDPTAKNKQKVSRVDKLFFPEHYDSDNFFRNVDSLNPETEVIITQKIHGTSIRVGNTKVNRKLNLLEKLLSKLRVKIQPTEYDYIYGSRKVIKDINNPNQQHWYETDIWSEEGKKLDGLLPQNFMVFAEVVGYTANGAEIQKNYTYGIPEGKCELYIYRVAFINEQGVVFDLSWDQTKEFCRDRGLKHVVELWRGKLKDFKVDDYLNKRFYDQGFKECLPLPNNKNLVDEGVCVRVDRIAPYILKAKSSIFLEHESKVLDEGTEDLESQENVVE